MELMLAEGFIATSVDDICRKAGVTKGSFFHFFASKDELGKAVVEHFHCAQQARFSRAPFASERDPLRRALGMLDAVAAAMADPSLPKSCIIGNFSQELAPTRAEFRALCAGKFDHWIGGFSADLAAAAQARRMKVDAAGLGALFVSIVQGSLILIKAKGDPALGAANLAHFKRYVEAQFRG
ncbi:MAG: TetR/AcrR family transcriptional regulator [Elusimicrobia bacterium]|nr:TetR/AcrR family transcriptional regulator [Elusimicrobiota bacterium]